MLRKLLAISTLVCASVISIAANAGQDISFSTRIMGQGSIYSIVDGDTLWLNVSDEGVFSRFVGAAEGNANRIKALKPQYRSVKMRIANINTDESVHRDASKNSASGKRASSYLKEIAEKRSARFACWDHGRYGRPICSVEFIDNDGDYVDIGYRMVSEGYSEYVTKYGKHPYAHREYQQADR